MRSPYSLLDAMTSPDAVRRMGPQEWNQLAGEVRLRISEVVAENGGHLGPNLGTVELIIACHAVFDFRADRLVFDVGHQAYPHKILTGRHNDFKSLRQKDGLSGYPHQEESPFDVYRGGHASTAISTSLGLLKGFLMGEDEAARNRHVVALVGDGSLTGGMAFEGLNHAGSIKERLIIILNDNRMSISPTVGALSKTLNNIRHKKIVSNLRNEFIRIVKRIPKFGGRIEEAVQLILEEAKTLINPKQIFTTMGFDYIGPLKGHDVPELVSALKQAKSINEPVLIHVLTEKGKGYLPEGASGKAIFGPHALSPSKGKKKEKVSSAPPAPDELARPQKTYSKCFAEGLVRLAERNQNIIGITAAMLEGTGLLQFQNAFPERCFDVGICEAHATGFAAGLATSGRRPVFAVYSTFLQRAFDQIFHEVVLQQKVPVLFCIDRAGLVGDDGPSHHGMYDIAYLRLYPGIVVMAPKDGAELVEMMSFAMGLEGPAAIRYPKAVVADDVFGSFGSSNIKLGKAEVLVRGKEVAFLAYGSMVRSAVEVAERLEAHGVSSTVVNARFAKPIDDGLVRELVEGHPLVVTMEEATACGGFGSAVLESANLQHLDTRGLRVFACPDKLVEHASRDEQLQHCALDPSNITTRVMALLKKGGVGVLSP